jgi:MFS family permease
LRQSRRAVGRPVAQPVRSGRSGAISFERGPISWLSYLMLACCCYVQGSLGPATSFLRDELRLDYTMVSLHLSVFAVGMVLAGSVAPRVAPAVRRSRLFWTGAWGLAAGAFALGMSRSPVFSLAAVLATGSLWCLTVVSIQAILAERYGDRRAKATALTEANLAGSIGSTCGAALLGALATTPFGWRGALVVPLIVVAVLALVSRRVPMDEARVNPMAEGRSPIPRTFWIFWLILILAVGIEWSVAFWIAPYFVDGLGLPRAAATLAAGGLFSAIVAGRVLGSHWTRRYPPDRLFFGTLLITLGGFLLLWLPGLDLAARLVGLAITGVGIANLFPLALSLGIQLGSANEDQVSARCTAAVGIGLIVFPLLLGRIADTVDIRYALGFVVVPLLFLAGVLQEKHVQELLRWGGRRLLPAGAAAQQRSG